MYGVTITELIQKMNLKNIIPEIDTDKVVLTLLTRRGCRSSALWSRSI